MSTYNEEASRYIKALASPQKEICQAMRELILGNFPNMQEAFKWRYPAYYHDGKRICLIGGFKHHANIELFYGSRLHDTQNRIAGLGKNTRHIKLHSLDDIDADYFVDLIRQSIQFARTSPRKH